MEEIVEKMHYIEQKDNESKNAVKDRKTAAEMRRQAMETYNDIEKRKKCDGNSSSSKRKRRSGDETIEYLREKMELKRNFRERELKIAQTRENTIQQLLMQQQQQNQAMLAFLMRQNSPSNCQN